MNQYIERVIEDTRRKHSYEPEFIQTVEEVFRSIEPLVEANPAYEENDILSRMAEPDRGFVFRVTWKDDAGNV